MSNRLFFSMAAGLSMAWAAVGSQTFVAHGLTNMTLGNAIYSSNQFYGFYVSNLGTNGTDGLSIQLGEADSGVFVYPATHDDPEPNTFMAGRLYGSVNGETNRLICFMRCYEQTDGYHPVEIDLSPLGPTHLTFQAFRRGALIAETGPQPGSMVVYGTYFVPYYPRVNPFWRARDGRVGALIEFAEPADMSLPGLGDISADRVFIRADDPTNVVDFASRLDITAELPWFQIYDARLGVFDRPHKALGNAHLHARPGILNVSNLGTNEEDGLAIELTAAVRFDAMFAPIQLDTNGLLTILALGNTEAGPDGAVGSVRLVRTGETVEISAHLDAGTNAVATNAVIAVYSNGVQLGTAPGTNVVVPASAAFVGCEVHTRIAEGQLGIVVHLEQSVSVTLPGQDSIQGNEIRFTSDGAFAVLKMLALNSTGLEEFTIVSEAEHPLPPPELQIVRSGNLLELSWLDPYRAFSLEATGQLGETFYNQGHLPNYAGDRATVLLQLDADPSGALFYRLSAVPYSPTED